MFGWKCNKNFSLIWRDKSKSKESTQTQKLIEPLLYLQNEIESLDSFPLERVFKKKTRDILKIARCLFESEFNEEEIILLNHEEPSLVVRLFYLFVNFEKFHYTCYKLVS